MLSPARTGREGRADGSIRESGLDGYALAAYWWVAYLGAALVLLLALLGAGAIFAASQSRMMERDLRAHADTLAQQVSSRIAAVRDQLTRWRADAGLRGALLDGRLAVLRAKEAELALLVPGAHAVMVLTNREIARGGSAARRLSPAGLDMVRQASEQARIAPLEAQGLPNRDAHLAIAGPITDAADAEVMGVVYISLPLGLLPVPAAGVAAEGRFGFRQMRGDALVAVRPADAETAPTDAPSVRLRIPDSHLELFAWAEPPQPFSGDLLAPLAALYALLLALLGVVLGVPYRYLRGSMRADLASMVRLVEDAVARRPLRKTPGRLRELDATLDSLRRRLSAPSPSAAVLRSSPAAEPAAQDDEVPADGPFSGPEADVGAHEAPTSAAPSVGVPATIFRAYDIRGLVGAELTDDVMRLLGRALGSEAPTRGEGLCIVARDQRPSSAGFAEALIAGLCESGCDVLDLGVAPTPLAYHAACARGSASAGIVTGSHNPGEYNGLKVVLGGREASQEELQGLRQRILSGDFALGQGRCSALDHTADYIRAVCEDITLARPMKLVLDCGFATASTLAPALYRALGCDVTTLDCDLDSVRADRRTLDPAQPKNLEALGRAVMDSGADLGLAFDPDGDRLGVVDSRGEAIASDRVLMLLAMDVLARAPGSAIVYDIKSSHRVGARVLQHGGRPVMWKSGHSFIKQKVREIGAPLGGELAGHIVFADRWNGFDDAFYAGARLLEVLALDPRSSAQVFAALPVGLCTPELFVPVPPGTDVVIMRSVLAMADRLDGVEVNTIDGLRAEFEQGWGLVRASNTRPGLVFRFEADDQRAMDKIQDLYRRMLALVAPTLRLPF